MAEHIAENSTRYTSRFFSASQRQVRAIHYSNLAKRGFDILVSVIGIIIFAPLICYIIVRIKRSSPGPVYYRGPRVGRGEKPFQILKFRTMFECPESYAGSRVTAQDDPRITPVGKWLRDTKLNELPQLWNVLKGEMSLVGPRPEDPEIAAEWPEQVRQEVLSVRPGITSPASVLYRDEESLLKNEQVMEAYLGEILPSKLRLDQLYVRHHSFWSDLDIIFWTFLVFVPRLDSYAPPEANLYTGPLWQLMRRYVDWFMVDIAITFLAMGLTGAFWRSLGPLNVGWELAMLLATGFAVLYSLTNAFLGVNRIEWSRAAAGEALDLLPGVALATALALLADFFFPTDWLAFLYKKGEVPAWLTHPFLPPGLILMAAGLAFLGFVAVRYRSRLITGLATRWVAWRAPVSTTHERVLIVGSGDSGQYAAWILNRGRYADSFRVTGFADDDLFKQGSRIQGFNVLGKRGDIPQIVEKHDIGIIIFAIHKISAAERQSVLEICASTPARVFFFPDIPGALGGIIRKSSGAHEQTDEDTTSEENSVDFKGLPCFLCLTKVSPLKVDGWLAQLEESARTSDMETLLTQIRELRQQVHGDAVTQLAANLAGEEV